MYLDRKFGLKSFAQRNHYFLT